MPPDFRPMLAKKACRRCSTQKRRCDKALPDCGLCKRLRQSCKYDLIPIGSLEPTPSPSPKPDVRASLRPGLFTLEHIRDGIIRELESFTPEDIMSFYSQVIEPWFPIVSISRLRSRLPGSWDEASIDVSLLCLCILLIKTEPSSAFEEHEEDNDTSKFMSVYLSVKSVLALTEGLGINSTLLVQSRILVTLFEIGHGLYPAAYISVGSSVRAADALDIGPWTDALHIPNTVDEDKDENLLLWCGIIILDRCIAVESGTQPPLTNLRSLSIEETLKSSIFTTHEPSPGQFVSICDLSHISEASSLLEKIHAIINSSSIEQEFSIEGLIITVQTLITLQTLLHEEIGDESHVYSASLSICNIALLLAFEHGSKASLASNVTANCAFIADTSLSTILNTVGSVVELVMLDTQTIDLSRIPPFTTFLVFKTAAIVTQRLLADSNLSEDLKRLKTLRKFLQFVAKRWLSCDRYLKLLDEDTTPRLLKILNQG